MLKPLSDLFLYFKYHFLEVSVIKGSSLSYKYWALKRFLKVLLSGREKNKNYLLPFDAEIRNTFGTFLIPKHSDLVLTLSSKSEADLINYFHITEGKIFLDIGANAGKYSVYLGRKNKNNRIYAFEPSPSTFQILKKNIELNSLSASINIFNLGLSDKKDRLRFFNSKHETGLSFIASDSSLTPSADYEENFIEVNSLDSVLEENKIPAEEIDLIKIDVENHEKKVLTGAQKTLSQMKKDSRILVEIFPDNQEREEILKLITNNNFTHRQLNEEYHLFVKKEQLAL